MQTIDEALNKLKKSDFRSRFHLKQKDIDYINEKGMNKICLLYTSPSPRE